MSTVKQIVKEIIRKPAELFLKVYLSTLPVKKLSPEGVGRILVFAYHGLGNFIMYTPALRSLRQRYPRARIDLQVGNKTGCEEVVAGAGLFDNIYNYPYSAGVRTWIKRALEIRRTKYDVTINEFHSHSWPLALLVAFSNADFRLGHVTSPGWSRRFSRYSFVFNLPVRMQEDEHEIDRYLDLVSVLDVPRLSLREATPFIHLTNEDKEFAERFLLDSFGGDSGCFIGIQPGTSPNMRWKQWPADRYRKLIESLSAGQPDSRIILFGAAGERRMALDMARGLESRVAVAAGQTSVTEAAALIERCELLVCNDSGLMHVAVAVGTPVVAIYGPTDVHRTAPLGPRHMVIRRELPCSPCFRLEGDGQVHLCGHHDCLMTIQPDEVLAAVTAKTSSTKEPAALKLAGVSE